MPEPIGNLFAVDACKVGGRYVIYVPIIGHRTIAGSYALEGPKLTRRGDWFYLTTAVGGTSGPPTGHLVTVARSHSVHGPWVDGPANPSIRTWDAKEPWWSRGHATLFEGPKGQW
ncbi:family 43 glycosylhydrolase [Arthrobacter nitrophenolicus]|uniref:family 43 glycosylhydrolase n=1 Tax=Arthrobacter nitrophenolicus TaxID=683150 RepID=UPI001F0E2064|nr:family 43 glycosylhydrolase [Arthrobacter nitrophenolicus]